VTGDSEGQVRFFQVLSLFIGKLDIERLCSPNQYSRGYTLVRDPLTNRLLQVLKLRRPDNRGGDSFEAPSDGDLSHLHALLLGQLLNTGYR
jgi:hypothetical protein